LNAQRTNGDFDRNIIRYLALNNNVDEDDLYQAFLMRAESRSANDEVNENTSEDEYRYQEYKVLCKSSGSDAMNFHSINHPIEEYALPVQRFFKSISLVPKLRETRAFVGFSRLSPEEKPISQRRKELRMGTKEDWLPAVEVFGEGIFIEFNPDALSEWAERASVINRVAVLNRAFQQSNFGKNSIGNLRPEYVMIHTMAHLIINQLSFDCGYGSSSIRERIYCEKTGGDLGMTGVLIYTASGDSEGSLGGLVRQGKSGRFEDTILRAVTNASWCASDPVCIQSPGQGPESLNLAACHNCTLLPETCCESGNRLLDRGLIVGTLSDKSIGFFSDLLG